MKTRNLYYITTMWVDVETYYYVVADSFAEVSTKLELHSNKTISSIKLMEEVIVL